MAKSWEEQMVPYPTNRRLHTILDTWDLHRRDIARLLYRSVLSTGICPSVDKWLKDPWQENFRPMRESDLRLLELELMLLETEHDSARDITLEGTPDMHEILKKARAARHYK